MINKQTVNQDRKRTSKLKDQNMEKKINMSPKSAQGDACSLVAAWRYQSSTKSSFVTSELTAKYFMIILETTDQIGPKKGVMHGLNDSFFSK